MNVDQGVLISILVFLMIVQAVLLLGPGRPGEQEQIVEEALRSTIKQYGGKHVG